MDREQTIPWIGKEIPWDDIRESFCRVKRFAPLAHRESSKLKDYSRGMPYCVLLVECPGVCEEAYLPVVHKLDFNNLWSVFKEQGIGPNEEVLISYAPIEKKHLIKLFRVFLPSLVIRLYPKGSLEKINKWCEGGGGGWEAIPRPLAEWDSRPKS